MKRIIHSLSLTFILLTTGAVTSAFIYTSQQASPSYHFPYKSAGLTDREAAAHLLSRFTFGAKGGDVDEVVKTGLEKWFAAQLQAGFDDKELQAKLDGYESLKMTNAEIVKNYPRGGEVLRMAIRDGVIDKDSAKADRKEYRDQIKAYMDQKGIKPPAELLRQLVNQKILTAAYSNNQLREVLTDFWFNHFNVAVSKGGVQEYVTSYEKDVIRPNVLGKFEDLLLATAKSPAMLTYLDNNKSTVNAEDATSAQMKAMKGRQQLGQLLIDNIKDTAVRRNLQGKIKKPATQGLNENYAREIMELHTLGVDGGYTQADVTQAARVLTGWSLNPQVSYGLQARRPLNERQIERLGIVYDSNFLFAAARHDMGEKKLLGNTFPAGVGYDEGVKLIHILATHPSTAKFISRKLAVRFVSDVPSQTLIDKMTKTFLAKGGDIKEVLITMVSAPEFWTKSALREKTKSPFELAISSVRATDAQITAPYQLYQWVNKMGQVLYNYQAPTGFPDKGQYWINTGSLLNRMNFGLALATGRIPGVQLNLLALNNNHEPESAEDALRKYSKLLMPERNVEETVKRLTPLLKDPELQKKVDDAAGKTTTAAAAMTNDSSNEMMAANENRKAEKLGGKKNAQPRIQLTEGNNSMIGQVVGIIIGSPEFQRR